MAAALSPLAVAAQQSVCKNAAVWTRSGSGANLIVLTDDRLIVARVSRKELKTAKRRLQNEEPLAHVVGEHSRSVYLGSIRRISTIRGSSDLSVEFEKAGNSFETLRVRLSSDAARDELLREARERLPGNAQIVKKAGNRAAHVLGPVNALFVCGLLAWGTHWFFSSPFADMKLPERNSRTSHQGNRSRPAPRDAQELAANATFRNDSGAVDNHQVRTRVPRNAARSKGAAALLLIVAILAAIGLALSWIGYQVALSVVIGLSAVSLFWLLVRLIHPPQTTELINTQKVGATAW